MGIFGNFGKKRILLILVLVGILGVVKGLEEADIDDLFDGFEEDDEEISEQIGGLKENKEAFRVEENEKKEVKGTTQKEKLKQAPKQEPIGYFRKYFFDLLIFFSISSYGLNYLWGVHRNKKIALEIATSIKPSLSTHFDTCGRSTEENEAGLELDHSHQYEYYCNGNKYSHYMYISMFLKRRQDLFTMMFRTFCFAEKDRIWIELPVKCEKPLEFLLIQNRETKDAFDSMEHLQRFIQPDKVPALKNTSLTLFVEHSAITEEIFTEEMFELIKQLEKSIVTLHVTDQLCYNNYSVCLKAQVAIFANRDYIVPMVKTLELIMMLAKRISKDYKVPQRAGKVMNEHRKDKKN